MIPRTRDNIQDIKDHLQITIPIEDVYDTNKHNCTFSSFASSTNTLNYALETFLTMIQHTYPQGGDVDVLGVYGYLTFWKFGFTTFYTLSINDLDEDGDFNNINNTFCRMISLQEKICDTERRYKQATLFYERYCLNTLRDVDMEITDNFNNVERSGPIVSIKDFYNWDCTKSMIEKRYKSCNDLTTEQIHIQYNIDVGGLFMRAFFSYTIPLQIINLYESICIEDMKKKAREYSKPGLEIDECETDIDYRLHQLAYKPIDDDIAEDLVILPDHSLNEKEEIRNRKRKREDNLKYDYPLRIKREHDKRRKLKKKEWGNIFFDYDWVQLNEKDQMCRNPIIYLTRIIQLENDRIDKLQYQINEHLNKYHQNYIKRRHSYIEKKKKNILKSRVKYIKAKLQYYRDPSPDTLNDVKVCKGSYMKMRKIFKVCEKMVLNKKDPDDQNERVVKIVNEVKMIVVQKQALETDSAYQSLLNQVKALEDKKLTIFKSFLIAQRISEVMPYAIKSIIKHWINDSDGKSVFANEYSVLNPSPEKNLGVRFREFVVGNLITLFNFKYTHTVYQLLKDIPVSVFNRFCDQVTHVKLIGAKGSGKSRTAKILMDISISSIFRNQSTIFSPKQLACNFNYNNYSTLMFDEGPNAFSSDGKGKMDGDFYQTLKILLTGTVFGYTFFWKMENPNGKNNGKTNVMSDRKQVNIYQHTRNGYSMNTNDVPKNKDDPMTDRWLGHNVIVKMKNKINRYAQTNSIKQLDTELNRSKVLFTNQERLQQVVIYSYELMASTGMFGTNNPFSTHIIDLLCVRVLNEFKKVFKTYNFGPRDIQRLKSSVLHCTLQRTYAKLFLVETSKYKYDKRIKIVYDHEKYPDVYETVINEEDEEEETNILMVNPEAKFPEIEEVSWDMHRNFVCTLNDFFTAITKTNSTRINLVEMQVTKVLFDEILHVKSFYATKAGPKCITNYHKDHIVENNKLEFGVFKSSGFSTEYDPNYICFKPGVSEENFYLNIKSHFDDNIMVEQIKEVFTSYQNTSIQSNFSYKRGRVCEQTNTFSFNDGNNSTCPLSISSPFLRKKYSPEFTLEFNIHGFKEFKGILCNGGTFEIYKGVIRRALSNVVFHGYSPKFYIWDEYEDQCGVFDVEKEVLSNLKTVKEVEDFFKPLKIKNPFYDSFKKFNFVSSMFSQNVKNLRLNKIITELRHKPFFTMEENIDNISKELHFGRLDIEEDNI